MVYVSSAVMDASHRQMRRHARHVLPGTRRSVHRVDATQLTSTSLGYTRNDSAPVRHCRPVANVRSHTSTHAFPFPTSSPPLSSARGVQRAVKSNKRLIVLASRSQTSHRRCRRNPRTSQVTAIDTRVFLSPRAPCLARARCQSSSSAETTRHSASDDEESVSSATFSSAPSHAQSITTRTAASAPSDHGESDLAERSPCPAHTGAGAGDDDDDGAAAVMSTSAAAPPTLFCAVPSTAYFPLTRSEMARVRRCYAHYTAAPVAAGLPNPRFAWLLQRLDTVGRTHAQRVQHLRYCLDGRRGAFTEDCESGTPETGRAQDEGTLSSGGVGADVPPGDAGRSDVGGHATDDAMCVWVDSRHLTREEVERFASFIKFAQAALDIAQDSAGSVTGRGGGTDGAVDSAVAPVVEGARLPGDMCAAMRARASSSSSSSSSRWTHGHSRVASAPNASPDNSSHSAPLSLLPSRARTAATAGSLFGRPAVAHEMHTPRDARVPPRPTPPRHRKPPKEAEEEASDVSCGAPPRPRRRDRTRLRQRSSQRRKLYALLSAPYTHIHSLLQHATSYRGGAARKGLVRRGTTAGLPGGTAAADGTCGATHGTSHLRTRGDGWGCALDDEPTDDAGGVGAMRKGGAPARRCHDRAARRNTADHEAEAAAAAAAEEVGHHGDHDSRNDPTPCRADGAAPQACSYAEMVRAHVWGGAGVERGGVVVARRGGGAGRRRLPERRLQSSRELREPQACAAPPDTPCCPARRTGPPGGACAETGPRTRADRTGGAAAAAICPTCPKVLSTPSGASFGVHAHRHVLPKSSRRAIGPMRGGTGRCGTRQASKLTRRSILYAAARRNVGQSGDGGGDGTNGMDEHAGTGHSDTPKEQTDRAEAARGGSRMRAGAPLVDLRSMQTMPANRLHGVGQDDAGGAPTPHKHEPQQGLLGQGLLAEDDGCLPTPPPGSRAEVDASHLGSADADDSIVLEVTAGYGLPVSMDHATLIRDAFAELSCGGESLDMEAHSALPGTRVVPKERLQHTLRLFELSLDCTPTLELTLHEFQWIMACGLTETSSQAVPLLVALRSHTGKGGGVLATASRATHQTPCNASSSLMPTPSLTCANIDTTTTTTTSERTMHAGGPTSLHTAAAAASLPAADTGTTVCSIASLMPRPRFCLLLPGSHRSRDGGDMCRARTACSATLYSRSSSCCSFLEAASTVLPSSARPGMTSAAAAAAAAAAPQRCQGGRSCCSSSPDAHGEGSLRDGENEGSVEWCDPLRKRVIGDDTQEQFASQSLLVKSRSSSSSSSSSSSGCVGGGGSVRGKDGVTPRFATTATGRKLIRASLAEYTPSDSNSDDGDDSYAKDRHVRRTSVTAGQTHPIGLSPFTTPPTPLAAEYPAVAINSATARLCRALRQAVLRQVHSMPHVSHCSSGRRQDMHEATRRVGTTLCDGNGTLQKHTDMDADTMPQRPQLPPPSPSSSSSSFSSSSLASSSARMSTVPNSARSAQENSAHDCVATADGSSESTRRRSRPHDDVGTRESSTLDRRRELSQTHHISTQVDGTRSPHPSPHKRNLGSTRAANDSRTVDDEQSSRSVHTQRSNAGDSAEGVKNDEVEATLVAASTAHIRPAHERSAQSLHDHILAAARATTSPTVKSVITPKAPASLPPPLSQASSSSRLSAMRRLLPHRSGNFLCPAGSTPIRSTTAATAHWDVAARHATALLVKRGPACAAATSTTDALAHLSPYYSRRYCCPSSQRTGVLDWARSVRHGVGHRTLARLIGGTPRQPACSTAMPLQSVGAGSNSCVTPQVHSRYCNTRKSVLANQEPQHRDDDGTTRKVNMHKENVCGPQDHMHAVNGEDGIASRRTMRTARSATTWSAPVLCGSISSWDDTHAAPHRIIHTPACSSSNQHDDYLYASSSSTADTTTTPSSSSSTRSSGGSSKNDRGSRSSSSSYDVADRKDRLAVLLARDTSGRDVIGADMLRMQRHSLSCARPAKEPKQKQRQQLQQCVSPAVTDYTASTAMRRDPNLARTTMDREDNWQQILLLSPFLRGHSGGAGGVGAKKRAARGTHKSGSSLLHPISRASLTKRSEFHNRSDDTHTALLRAL